MRPRPLAALLVAATLCAACGTTTAGTTAGTTAAKTAATTARPQSARLVLDFTPNAVHTGIYVALAQGLDTANGIALHVIVPSASTDSIKLLESGRVDFAVLDIHDLAIAREHGAGLVGIMALVQRPLSAVIAAPQITTPRQLEHRTVGITGVPSDTAVLRSIVTGAGGDPHNLRTITIGFNAVADLLAGRVAAATAFWNDEGVTLAARRPGFRSFRVDQYGAPAYPELILCTTARSAGTPLARAVVKALTAGYAFTERNPARATAALESQVQGLDTGLTATQLRALLPAFEAPDGRIGELDPGRLRAWAAWEVRFGIVTRPPDVSAMFPFS